jgi:hypothetical protein
MLCRTALFYLLLPSARGGHPDLGTLSDGTACQSSRDVVTINFEAASVAHSNLGSTGPDWDAPPTVLLTNVGTLDNRRIDLEISNLTYYEPIPPDFPESVNGLKPESNGPLAPLSYHLRIHTLRLARSPSAAATALANTLAAGLLPCRPTSPRVAT